MGYLKGKKILLTGASSGIGREMAKQLVLRYGASVIGIGRNEEKLQALQAELGERFSYCAMDVSVKENWISLAQKLKTEGAGIDLLINNAGMFPQFTRVEDMTSEQISQVMDVNFYACVNNLTQKFLINTWLNMLFLAFF